MVAAECLVAAVFHARAGKAMLDKFGETMRRTLVSLRVLVGEDARKREETSCLDIINPGR